MPSRNATNQMWAEACALLARADRLHRDFFQPGRGGWEPPVDLFETERELVLIAALPGVVEQEIDLVIGGGALTILGTRGWPPGLRAARVHRIELPQGRFERRIPLPAGTYELGRYQLADGCLTVTLRKLP